MSKVINIIATLLLCVGLASCIKDNDNVTVVNDCYITSVSLGTMRREVHSQRWVDSLQAYKDTTYLASYNGSYYRMAINQLDGTIYNRDSLLYNTRLGNVLLTISAVGTVLYRPENQIEEQWTAYSSKDSIDVSGPLLLRVTNGVVTRDYRMTLNIHKEDPDVFNWSKMETWGAPQPDADSVKAVWNSATDELIVMSSSDAWDTTCQWYRPGHGGSWAGITGDEDILSYADAHTLTLFAGRLWASTCDGMLIRTDVGHYGWSEAPAPFPLRVIGATDQHIYAMRLDSTAMYHAGDDLVWELDECDTPDMMPTGSAVGLGYTMPGSGARIMMMGRHDDDSLATVWGKTVASGQKTQWIHYPWRHENYNPLPALSRMSVIRYNGDLVAIGGSLEAAYVSVDNGVTWKKNYNRWTLPEGLDPSKATALTADNHGRVWLINGGDVYCGRAHSQQ